MTKSILTKRVAENTGISLRLAEKVIESTFQEIFNKLVKGEKVVISGLGTFYIGRVKDKDVVPFGDESKRQTVKSHNTVNFRVGKPLKRAVN